MSPQKTPFWKRLTSSTRQLHSEDLQRAAESEGAVAVASCQDRDIVRLAGQLALVTVNPHEGSRWLEAELDDGSGRVHLVWMGRRKIHGIEAGRHLKVEGRLSYVDGRRTVYNPRYELLP